MAVLFYAVRCICAYTLFSDVLPADEKLQKNSPFPGCLMDLCDLSGYAASDPPADDLCVLPQALCVESLGCFIRTGFLMIRFVDRKTLNHSLQLRRQLRDFYVLLEYPYEQERNHEEICQVGSG